MLVAGILLTLLLFFTPSTGSSKPTHSYTYTDFINAVTGNQVKTATIDPNGHVSGTLANGDNYTSQIPTAIRDDQLAPLLKQHNVQIKGNPSGGISIGSVIINLLPFVLLVGFLDLPGPAHQPAAGRGHHGRRPLQSQGVRPRRPPGDPLQRRGRLRGGQAEVSEVVDFLKHPDKYQRAGAVGPRGVLDGRRRPGRARRCWPGPWPARPRCRSWP